MRIHNLSILGIMFVCLMLLMAVSVPQKQLDASGIEPAPSATSSEKNSDHPTYEQNQHNLGLPEKYEASASPEIRVQPSTQTQQNLAERNL